MLLEWRKVFLAPSKELLETRKVFLALSKILLESRKIRLARGWGHGATK
jgi:hypothetical protein